MTPDSMASAKVASASTENSIAQYRYSQVSPTTQYQYRSNPTVHVRVRKKHGMVNNGVTVARALSLKHDRAGGTEK